MHGAAESLEAVTGRDTVPGVEVDRELDRYVSGSPVATTGAEEEASAARCCSTWPA